MNRSGAKTPDQRCRGIIRALRLKKHREGGYFRESYRSGESLGAGALPKRYGGRRSLATAIYYLLPSGEFSAFHRLKSDETWCFHQGCPLDLFMLNAPGGFRIFRMGISLGLGHFPQVTVPRGTWLAARPCRSGFHSLVTCFVSPGFDFEDFELGSREELLRAFPEQGKLIFSMTVE